MPTFRPELRHVPIHRPGPPPPESVRRLLDGLIELGANESPLPPFREVQRAVAEHVAGVNRYPDNDCGRLREALADQLGVPGDHLWFGGGSSELLLGAALAVGGPGTSIAYGWPSFVLYPIICRVAGATPIEVPLDGRHRLDLAAMAAALRPDTTAVYLCNPNNPTGTYVPGAALEEWIGTIPERVLVVIDEAYAEYALAEDFASALPLTASRNNLLVTRTFSKVFGLAGLRVGYAVAAPSTLEQLGRTQLPFTVSSPAQVAATEALRWPGRLEERARGNAAARSLFSAELATRGIPHADSQANFVYLRPGDDERRTAQLFEERGVIIRPVAGGWVRVTVGSLAENARFFSLLDEIAGGGSDFS